ncbi:MAG: isoprenylcysteine carboxylmethyltransferase family protein [Candidatus Kapaibacterium sp.]
MFYYFLSFIIVVRIIELIIAKNNEKWLRSEGAVEYGREHYKYFILLHTGFFISMITEYNLSPFSETNYIPMFLFFIVQIFRLSIFISLGKYWNTRILVIPGRTLVKKGLYRYIKHPNYIIVIFEFILIPLSFSLFVSMLIFSVLNLVLLSVRIKVENKALGY